MVNPQMVMYEEEFNQIKAIISKLRVDANAKVVFLVDKNGQQIATAGDVENIDATSLASLTAGNVHSCALLTNGTVKCWGGNGSGQLGLGDTLNRGDTGGEMGDALPAINLGTGRTATAITAGSTHTCALLDNNTVKCWGTGADGRLGQDSTTNLGDNPGEMAALNPVKLGTGRSATAMGERTVDRRDCRAELPHACSGWIAFCGHCEGCCVSFGNGGAAIARNDRLRGAVSANSGRHSCGVCRCPWRRSRAGLHAVRRSPR